MGALIMANMLPAEEDAPKQETEKAPVLMKQQYSTDDLAPPMITISRSLWKVHLIPYACPNFVCCQILLVL